VNSGADEDSLRLEAASTFDGEVVVAHDEMQIVL